ncbi:type II secretion system minor pseudopilin GspJ [Yersinia sp. 2466 StPb PI]|uniref:type II secretion system minor pseudopilin GspJ n=1 Tax=Yersinia sp. 2466 StPb PI TaxID=3061648 RepID=UPI00355B42B3
MTKRLSYGFTLLEVLLAVIIFTMMSLTIYQAVIVIAKGSAAASSKEKILYRIYQVIEKLQDDISHAITYQNFISNDYQGVSFQIGKGLLGSDDFGVYFLLNNNDNLKYDFDYMPESIGYRLKNKVLQKLSYTKIGCIADPEYKILDAIDGVSAFRMQIYHERKWLNEWRSDVVLPYAVEFTIELEGIGMVRRVIILLNSGVL